MLITSATLTDNSGERMRGEEVHGADAWRAAEARLGVNHLSAAVSRLSLPSPFDYARQTRILIVKAPLSDRVTDSQHSGCGQVQGRQNHQAFRSSEEQTSELTSLMRLPFPGFA